MTITLYKGAEREEVSRLDFKQAFVLCNTVRNQNT